MDAPLPCTLCPLRPRPVFKPVSASQLTWLQQRKVGQLKRGAGATIVEPGATDERIYTLLSGWAFRYNTLPDGRRQILNFLLPGDMVGLQAELTSAAPHGVEAVTAVSLCAFKHDTVLHLVREHAELALDLTWLAAHSERMGDDVLLTVGRRNATERVATLLVHLFKRASSVGLDVDGSIAFPLTQTHVADALGLSPVHVNRVLQALRRARLIRLADGRLGIGDLRALRRVAAYWEQPAPFRPLL